MKNYMNIKRLFENELTQDSVAEFGMQPDSENTGSMESGEMDIQAALPAPGETTSAADPMTMTVNDFVNKCREIDPLVCMGIEAFIEKNRSTLITPAQPAQPAPAENPEDLNFSNTVNPPAAPGDVTFSNVVAPEPAQMNMPAQNAAPTYSI